MSLLAVLLSSLCNLNRVSVIVVRSIAFLVVEKDGKNCQAYILKLFHSPLLLILLSAYISCVLACLATVLLNLSSTSEYMKDHVFELWRKI